MRNGRLLLPGLAAFAVALVASGVLHREVPEGLPVTPSLTLLMVPIARLAMFALGALAFGSALVITTLGGSREVRRIGVLGSAGYALVTALVLVLTLADALARDWWSAIDLRMLRSFATQIDEGRYLTAQILIGAVACWVLSRGKQLLDFAFAAIALGIAITLPAFSGHSAAALPHWVASATMVVHLLALSAWIGGVAILLLVPSDQSISGFSRIASIALPAVLVSGVASVVARINDWASVLHDSYTLVLLVKIAATGAVIWFAAQTRQRLRDSLAATSSGKGVAAAVRRTLAVEGALMFVVLGLGVVLARMANP